MTSVTQDETGMPEAALEDEVATTPSPLYVQEQAKQKAELERLRVMVEEMEQGYTELTAERDSLQGQLQRSQKALRESNVANVSSEELSSVVSQQKRDLQALQSQLEKSQEEAKAAQERVSRTETDSDRLRDEIQKLNEANSKMSSQLANMEIESKLQESEAVPLMHERDRLRTEMESLQSHNNWLQGELEAKTSAYQRLQHDAHDRQLQLQLQLQQTENEKEAFAVREEELRKIEGRLQTQVEQLSRDMMLAKQDLASVKENTALEIQQERKMANLQKEHLVRWEQRYNDIVRENESLKKAAIEAQTVIDQQIVETRLDVEHKYRKLLDEQAAGFQLRIEQDQVTRAALPAVAVLPGPDDDDAPMGLTEVYERLEQAKAQLRKEKLRADRAEILNQRIVKEIEEKTPLMNRQREEYELAMDQMQEYQSRLEQALQEKEQACSDNQEARFAASKWRRQYDDKVMEVQVLAKQVQSLLVNRAGGEVQEGEVSTVAEMQTQNQQLLVENKRLQDRANELEHRLNANEMTSKLEAAKSEMDALRHQRKLQEDAVEKIIQQRDLYRSLCNINGNMSSGQELTVQEFSKQQIDRVKKLERELAEADQRCSAVSGHRDKLLREKEAMEERLLRYEAHTKELSESLNQREGELQSARGDLARGRLEAMFHADKCVRLEESVQRHRDELSHVVSAKNELQRINAQLQHSLTEVKNLVAQKETEKQQAETRLRLAETQAETAKQAQKRATEEANHLRTEVAMQGTLIDSIRRIENSLTATSEGKIESLKEEVDRLNKEIAGDRKRHEVELENLLERAIAAEARFDEAVKARDKALADVANMEKSLNEATSTTHTMPTDAGVSAQEKIDMLSTELSSAKAEIASLRESAEEYKKEAKGNESSMVDFSKAATMAKQALQEELAQLKSELQRVKEESVSKQDVILEMTQSLSGAREEREKSEGALQGEISFLKSSLLVREKDVESAQAALAAIKFDLDALQKEVSEAQGNYERELTLHAEARSSLRGAIEKAENEAAERVKATKEVEILQHAIEQERNSWSQEKDSIREASLALEKSLKEARDHNNVLHSQLETLGTQIQQSFTARVNAAPGEGVVSDEAQKQVQEMREVVIYLRSENKMIQNQLDTASRGMEREKAAAGVLQYSLDEARAELASLKGSTELGKLSVVELATIKEKLKASDEQVALLTDSNKLLRSECQRLHDSIKASQEELIALRKQLEPAENEKHDQEAKLAMLEAEKQSLRRELDAWKGRVENLVKKFNQVDPEEHRKALGRVEVLTKEKEALDKWKTTTGEENSRIRDIARNLKQKLLEQTAQLEEKNKQIEKLTSEKESSNEVALIKERDELKTRLVKLEKETASVKMELDGTNVRNDKLRERLRLFQTTIRELKDKNVALEEKLESAIASAKAAESKAKEQPMKAAETIVAKSQVPLAAQVRAEKAKEDQKAPAAESKVEDNSALLLPAVPTGGFRFGPSPVQLADSESQPSDPSKSPLRPDASPFAPAKKPESAATDTRNAKRAASTETMEMSVKEKLMAKKRKVAELLQRQQELKSSMASKKDDDTSEPKVPAQDSKQIEQVVEKSTPSEPVSCPPVVVSTLPPTSTTEDKEEELVIESFSASDDIDADVQEDGAVAETDYGEDAPETSIPNLTLKQNAPFGIAAANNPFAVVGSKPFGGSSTPPIFGQPPSVAEGSSVLAASGTFLDMKAPGTLSSPPSFSFGQITLPVPAQQAPTPSPFGAFGSSCFGGFGEPNQNLAARPLFGTPPVSALQSKEKSEETEKKGDS